MERVSNTTQQRKNQRAFLAAYAAGGNISQAATAAGISRQQHYAWIKDPAYKEEFENAHEAACESLEEEARRRAVTGWEEPVFHRGAVCGGIRKFSDTLLIFLMKGAMPEKYKDRVQAEVHADSTITDAQLEKIVAGALVKSKAE